MAQIVHAQESLTRRAEVPPVALTLHAESARSVLPPSPLPAGLALLDYRVRLVNRDELISALGLTSTPAKPHSTENLLLQAYRRWGVEMVRQLRGDWWFALWDGACRRLLLARDATSPTPLYFAWDGAGLIFAPTVVEILGFPGFTPRPCEERLVTLLLPWMYGNPGLTEYEGVRQLLPGHYLIWSGQDTEPHRYWFPEALPPVRLNSDGEYVEGLLSCYQQAVADCLVGESRVGSMLSAGLDSGSVTALAAQALRARGERLAAFTYTPPAEVAASTPPGRLYDEWPLAAETARLAGDHVDHIAVGGIHPLRANDSGLAITGLLQGTNLNMPWLLALCEAARQRGLTLLLNGQCGNFSLSWESEPPSLIQSWHRGGWPEVREVLAAGRQATATLLLRSLAGRLRRWVLGPPAPDIPALAHTGQQLLNPSRLPAWRERLHAQIPDQPPRGAHALREFFLPHFLASTSFNGLLAAAHGLVAADPTADQRVMEYCLGLPDDLFHRQGWGRWLMRQAMAGQLPPAVRWNRARGLQIAGYPYQLKHVAADVDALLARLRQSDLANHYLNMPYLDQCWQRVRLSESWSEDVGRLGQGLGFGQWCLRQEGLAFPAPY